MLLCKTGLFRNACLNINAFNELKLLACFISQNGSVRLVSHVVLQTMTLACMSSVTVPFRNIWVLPNAFKKVIVFASFALRFCLRYVSLSHFCSATTPTSCWDCSMACTFFLKPPNLPTWHTFAKWFDRLHFSQEAPYAGHLRGGCVLQQYWQSFGECWDLPCDSPFCCCL